jgi:hypothetical protein
VLTRRGTSLVELVIALALAGLVLGTAAASLLRQQRSARWVGALGGSESQMRPLAQLLPAELAPLDAAAGDVAAGEASDSTLQLRAVVASSLACDSAAAVVVLVPDAAPGVAIAGVARAPVAGDSVWLHPSDSVGWLSRRVVGVTRASTGCSAPPALAGGAYRLALDAPADVPGGTPLRVTRQERYAVYKAGDGRWYLGIRAWSASTGSFAAPQPLAGPFVRSVPGGGITGFRYFDSAGAPLVPDGSNERAIARVRVSSIALVPSVSGTDSLRRDSADVALVRHGAF